MTPAPRNSLSLRVLSLTNSVLNKRDVKLNTMAVSRQVIKRVFAIEQSEVSNINKLS